MTEEDVVIFCRDAGDLRVWGRKPHPLFCVPEHLAFPSYRLRRLETSLIRKSILKPWINTTQAICPWFRLSPDPPLTVVEDTDLETLNLRL